MAAIRAGTPLRNIPWKANGVRGTAAPGHRLTTAALG